MQGGHLTVGRGQPIERREPVRVDLLEGKMLEYVRGGQPDDFDCGKDGYKIACIIRVVQSSRHAPQ